MKEDNNPERVGQDQVHDLLFGEKVGWQGIIYDLINTEQLNPWDVDIILLSNKYLEKIKELEEANFFVSSKVLLAASLLLRIKTEILLNKDLQTLDDVLFGKEETKKYEQERIELDEDIPELIPRTPLPRFKRVTLNELMEALGKAMKTETRRIKREIMVRQQERYADIVLPKNTVNLKDKIRELYGKLKKTFLSSNEKIAFSDILNETEKREDKIISFVSLLHLDNQQKVWLEQENHFEEIWILLKEVYLSRNKEKLEMLRNEIEALEVEQETKILSEGEEELEYDESVGGDIDEED